MISLKQIQYALAVEQTLHFKKAAELCFVSQSALSTALAEMEKQLGVLIFERNNKQVLITPVGRRILDKARQIKIDVEDLHRLAEQQDSPLNGEMTVGMIPTIGPYLLPRMLPALQEAFPDFTMTVVEERSSVLLDQLRAGDLDTAILALPYDHEGLLAFPFLKENFHWIMHKEEDVASLKSISAEEVDPKRLMLLKDGHCLKDHALAACKLQQKNEEGLRAVSLFTLVQMAAGRMGCTLVPEIAVKQLVASNESLVSVPLEEPGPHRELAFIVRPNYPNLGNIEQLISLLGDVLSDAV